MNHYHCRYCHHEWDNYTETKCGWCGAIKPVLLETTKPLDYEAIAKSLMANNKE